MFGHLGANAGEQERKMRQLGEKLDFGWGGRGAAWAAVRCQIVHANMATRTAGCLLQRVQEKATSSMRLHDSITARMI